MSVPTKISFVKGEYVTWTHAYQRGRFIYFSVREGQVVTDQGGDVVLVRYRSKMLSIRRDRVRHVGQQYELTDMVMGPEHTPVVIRHVVKVCKDG